MTLRRRLDERWIDCAAARAVVAEDSKREKPVKIEEVRNEIGGSTYYRILGRKRGMPYQIYSKVSEFNAKKFAAVYKMNVSRILWDGTGTGEEPRRESNDSQPAGMTNRLLAVTGRPGHKPFHITLTRTTDTADHAFGEALVGGDKEAEVLALEILNAIDRSGDIDFEVRYAEADVLIEKRRTLDRKSGRAERMEVAWIEQRLQALGYQSCMIRQRLLVLFHPMLTKQCLPSTQEYSARILGLLAFMAVRGGWLGSDLHEVEVFHTDAKNYAMRPAMRSPIAAADFDAGGIRSHEAEFAGHTGYLVNAQHTLRDRYGFPIMLDLIAMTSFVPSQGGTYGSYGPVEADKELFNLNNWLFRIY